MTKLEKYIAACVCVLLLAMLGISFYKAHQQKLGAISIPDSPYLFITTLTGNITSSDSSMTLNNGTFKNGTSLSGYQCFTLDAGTATAEYACGTASGTAISTLIRGIDPQNPAATSTALAFPHRRGADVRITDFPILQIVKRLVNGQDSFPNPLLYDSSVSSSTLSGNLQAFASVSYANGIALQGSATATTTVPGVVRIATTAQVIAGTGMTGQYTLVPAASLFNQTPSASVIVPVTNSLGKLDQGFFDLTSTWLFTGSVSLATTTIAATTTKPLILNSISYTFPNSQGAASTSLINDASGNLRWGNPVLTAGAPTSTSASRNVGTFYQNTTGRNILVNVNANPTMTNCAGYTRLQLITNTATASLASMNVMADSGNQSIPCSNNQNGSILIPLYMIVPPNYYYEASGTAGTTLWIETPL